MDYIFVIYFVAWIAVPVLIFAATREIYKVLNEKYGRACSNTFAVTVVLVVGYMGLAAFPTCGCGGEMPRQTSCISNMKQLGLGFIQYSQDWDGRLPGGQSHWAGAIYSYERSTGIYKCPDDKTKEPASGAYVCSYAMNANIRRANFSDLSAPSVTVLATEMDGTPVSNFVANDQKSGYTNGLMPNSAWGGIRLGSSADPVTPPRHDPRSTFLSCDGHVRLLPPGRVSGGFDNPLGEGVQTEAYAAGTKNVAAPGAPQTLTFSSR